MFHELPEKSRPRTESSHYSRQRPVRLPQLFQLYGRHSVPAVFVIIVASQNCHLFASDHSGSTITCGTPAGSIRCKRIGKHCLWTATKKGPIRRSTRKSFRRGCLKGTPHMSRGALCRKCEEQSSDCRFCILHMRALSGLFPSRNGMPLVDSRFSAMVRCNNMRPG